MDEQPETDEGYVTLVNVEETNGELRETEKHTGMWAWKHPHHDGTLTYTKLEGRVVFDHVDFGYTPDKTVLHDISLYAEPGQKIAFVGATGAGKTTITNLINRFYDIDDGKIRYDGININKIRKADLRRSQPEFRLQEELKNPEMRRLMQLPGMRMRDAYRLAHYDESLHRAAQAVEQGVVQRIHQRAARPTENGIRPGGAATVRPDVASMTRAQREALERRVLHGAQIEL